MQVTNPPALVLCKARMMSCTSFYKHPDIPKVQVKVGLTPPLCSHEGETAPPFIRSALKLDSCYVSWVPWYEVVNMKCGWHVDWQQWQELCEQVAQWIAEVSQAEAEVEEPVCLQPRNTTSEWNAVGAGDSWAVVLTEGRQRKEEEADWETPLKALFCFQWANTTAGSPTLQSEHSWCAPIHNLNSCCAFVYFVFQGCVCVICEIAYFKANFRRTESLIFTRLQNRYPGV